MSDHRQALQNIMKICNESSQYNRRVQAIHEEAMKALGLTESQRQERHVKAMMRAEKYKFDRECMSERQAKARYIECTEAETGEIREKHNRQYVKG